MKPEGLSKNRLGVVLPTHLLTNLNFQKWLRPAVILAGLTTILLPLNLLSQQPFHHDEALYATWALEIASGKNVWLAETPIDKPPLFLYTLAGSMWLLGPTETAARLPSLLATAVIVGLTFWLGRKLYGAGVGLLAAWLVALSPFTILFAPTAFTDPLLVVLVLASGVAAAYGRTGWAGLWLGLAIATKQQGLFFGPLVVGLIVVTGGRQQVAGDRSQVAGRRSQVASGKWQVASGRSQVAGRRSKVTGDRSQVASGRWQVPGGKWRASRFTLHAPRSSLHTLRFTRYALLTFLLMLLLTLIPLFIWEAARCQSPGLWQLSLANYGGLTANAGGFSERWLGFVELLQYGTASPFLNTLFLVGLPLLLLYDLWQIRPTPSKKHHPSQPTNQPTAPPYFDWLLFLFSLAYLLGHAWLSFQVWDRYLLGLIPLLALLLARVLLWPWSILKEHWLNRRPNFQSPAALVTALLLGGLLITTMSRPAQDAVNGRYPLGSHSQALHGIDQIVAYLQGHIGANHTLYHRWLGPHWRFYLWDYPYDLQYWQSPEELAARAKPGHLIAFPSWQSDTLARLALAGAGLELRELTRAYHPLGYPTIILYQIE